jgi:uncharacterized coiled-coil protein SlyX/DNA-binding Xre family transcriptional regulator
MDTVKNPIGLQLKQLAKSKKIPISDIAERMHLSTQGVYNIFTRKSVGSEVLIKFCEAIGANPNEVLGIGSVGRLTSNINNDQTYMFQKQIEELQKLVAQQSQTIAQLAQSNQALIEKLGKFEASGLLAEYDA